MTEREHGFADNYAGVARTTNKPHEWLAGWDEAQEQRLNDEREMRALTNQLQPQQSSLLIPRTN